ncbi:MAG: hypothetical protein GQ564_11450 [Bacteroidales bacterium]|nr:hypothetical protein [Bacteroidales bacterium]
MSYDIDNITFRYKLIIFRNETLKDFENELLPLKWIEEKTYKVPAEIAKNYGIKFIFFGAIYPYSISDSLRIARKIGFKDLDDFNEWSR